MRLSARVELLGEPAFEWCDSCSKTTLALIPYAMTAAGRTTLGIATRCTECGGQSGD